MTAARGLAAALAGGLGGIGEGMVAEARAEREAMLERMRQAHQSAEAEKNRQLTRDEGEKTRALTVSEAEKTRTQQAEQAGAEREDRRNEGVLNRAQQGELAKLARDSAEKLKKMDIEATRDDPSKWPTGADGSIYRPVKAEDGTMILTRVKDSEGKDVRRATSRTYVQVGSDGKVYGDGEDLPEGVALKMRVDAGAYLTSESRKAIANTKAETALAIQDMKNGTTLTKAQIEATAKIMIEGMKGEASLARAQLIRDAISADQDKALKAQAELKREGFDVQKEIAAAYNENREKIAAATNATRLQTAGAGQRAKLDGDERTAYENRLKREAEAEYENLRGNIAERARRGLMREPDPTGGVSRERWVRQYVDREMAKRDGEQEVEQTPSEAGAGKPETGSLRTNSDKTRAASKPLPEGWDEARAITSAKAALAQGKPRAEIEARLREYGIDPAKLGQ